MTDRRAYICDMTSKRVAGPEIEKLIQAGVDTVQLDEPWLSTLVDPNFRRRERITDVEYESALGYPGLPRAVVVGGRFNLGLGR